MKKIKKIGKACSLALALMMLGGVQKSFTGCGGGGGDSVENKIAVWTTDAQEKVLQNDDSVEIPEEIEPLSIEMAKGEYEGAQIMMRAKKAVNEYTVKVSRLKNGDAYIPEDQVSVYNEKYIQITKRLGNNKDFPIGSMVPDAILPMDTAIEYDENTIEANNNQGIYIEVETSLDTAPGVYTGNVTITADGAQTVVPVQVTVWDFEIPETPSTQNYWSRFSRDAYATFEMDATDEMDTLYFEKQLEYRMNCYLPFCGDGGIPRYVELLRKYYNWKGFSTYNVYYECISTTYNGVKCNFNAELLKDYLKAIVEASLEDNINYLDKAIFYFCNIIDEPSDERPGSFENVMMVDTVYRMMMEDLNNELLDELSTNPNYQYYLDVVGDTLVNIPNILTLTLDGAEQVKDYGIQSLTPCFGIDVVGTAEKRDQAYNQDEFDDWFYSCVYPLYPYVTTHIDDYLLSSRVVSWMQKAYDIEGYLNWASNLHLWDNYGNPVDDPYAEALRGAYTPGDGFLFYPGAKYGIRGPVASLRAVSYRDGIEDYEYLNLLEEIYAERNLSSETAEQGLYKKIFSDIISTTDRDVFYSTRRELANMITSCTSDVGVLYESLELKQGRGTIRFNTYNEEATVEYKGEILQKGADGLYEIVLDLTKETFITITINCNGQTATETRVLSGIYKMALDFENEADIDLIKTFSDSIKTANADATYVSNGAGSLRIELVGRVNSNTHEPYFAILADAINGGDLTKVENVTLSVYNAEAEAIAFRLETYITTTSQYPIIGTYTLQPGWNYISLNVSSMTNREHIGGFYFVTENIVESTDDGMVAGSKTIYVDEIAYTVAA